MDQRQLRVPVTIAAGVRLRWERQSAATGWAFPGDWYVPAVEALCEAVVAGGDVWGPGERLGRERAAAGVSLGETLADVDVLIDVEPGTPAEMLRRAVSLGWADRVVAPPAAVVDALTGLVSPDYLDIRLCEIYQAAEANGRSVSNDHALVVVQLDLAGRTGLDRALPMMVVGDALRTVFSAGQTLALLSDRLAVCVTDRVEPLHRQAGLVHDLLTRRFADDPSLRVGRPEVWVEALPGSAGSAIDLVRELG